MSAELRPRPKGDLLAELDRLPLEGKILDDGSRGKFGWAMIEGIRFGVTRITLEMGAVIFQCTLMKAATFPFVIKPGSPAKIYGGDDQLIVDYLVPGLGTDAECRVRPGDQVTIYLPIKISDVTTPVRDGARVPNDAVSTATPLHWRRPGAGREY